MMRRLPAGLALIVACVCLVACGSSGSSTTQSEALSPQQYKEFLKQVGKGENAAHVAVEESLRSNDTNRLMNALAAFAKDQEGRAEELSSVTPPQNARSAHAKLERALDESAAAIDKLIPELEEASSTKEALATIQKATGAQEAGEEIDSALAELRKLGYTPGS